MGNVSDNHHPRETAVSRVALAVGKEIVSQILPGSGIIIEALKEFKRTRIFFAQQSLLKELSNSDRTLTEHELDEFIPITYKFFKAAEEGLANRNIRLLSKLVHDEVDSESISADRYESAAHVAKLLSIKEVAALSVVFSYAILPDMPESAGDLDSALQRYDGIHEDIHKKYPGLFPDENAARFVLASLSGKGLLIPVIIARFGRGFPSYAPTDLAKRLGAHAHSMTAAPE